MKKNKGGFCINIDFTKLNNLAAKSQETKRPQEAPKMAIEQPGDNAGKAPTAEAESNQGGQNEGYFETNRLQRKADEYKETIDRAAAAYKHYQHNILAAGQLRSEIARGAAAGEDIYTLFLKAVETIGKMTGDSLFIDQIGKSIKSVYGIGLKEEQPLNLEILETRTRLKKLKTAWKRETDLESRDRIGRAIDAHEARIKKLERMAASAKERPA